LFLYARVEYSNNFDAKAIEKIDRVIYFTSEDPSKDSFTSEVAEAIKEIEDFLRPRLNVFAKIKQHQ